MLVKAGAEEAVPKRHRFAAAMLQLLLVHRVGLAAVAVVEARAAEGVAQVGQVWRW